MAQNPLLKSGKALQLQTGVRTFGDNLFLGQSKHFDSQEIVGNLIKFNSPFTIERINRTRFFFEVAP
jgi:hypothetical protein